MSRTSKTERERVKKLTEKGEEQFKIKLQSIQNRLAEITPCLEDFIQNIRSFSKEQELVKVKTDLEALLEDYRYVSKTLIQFLIKTRTEESDRLKDEHLEASETTVARFKHFIQQVSDKIIHIKDEPKSKKSSKSSHKQKVYESAALKLKYAEMEAQIRLDLLKKQQEKDEAELELNKPGYKQCEIS